MNFKHNAQPPRLTTSGSLTESRMLRVNPEFNVRLDCYMENNPGLTEFYTDLVQNNPQAAIRALMLSKMMNHEAWAHRSGQDFEAISSLSIRRRSSLAAGARKIPLLHRRTNVMTATGALKQ